MKIAGMALAALVAAPAFADDPKPYVLYNGRGAVAPAAAPAPSPAKGGGAGAPSGSVLTAASQASTFGSSTVRPSSYPGDPAAAAAAAMAAAGAASGSSAGQAVRGVKRHSAKRGVAKSSSRKADGDAPPPNYSKPGALIRTEGQLPIYTDPGNAGTHSVEGGGFVDIDPRRAKDVGRSPGVAWGAPDTPPSANPTSGGGAGGNGVTANGPAITVNNIDNSHSNNTNGNQNGGDGNGNGNGNGNGHGNSSVSGFDPSF